MSSEHDLFANFERMRREMDELFGNVFERSGLSLGRRGFLPRVDVYYTKEPYQVVVVAELAGIDRDSVRIEVEGRWLTLLGHRRSLSSEEGQFQQVEIEHGPFKRRIDLGADVIADKAEAAYRDGLLQVSLPIAGPSRHARSVPIKVSSKNEAD